MTETFEFHPSWASPPGDTISVLLRERNLSQADLAERTGYSRKHINELVRGRAPISYEAALKLEFVLGSAADFWMRREVLYREAIARKQVYQDHAKSAEWLESLPIVDMVRHGWIDRCHDKGQQVAECLRFFGVASVAAWKTTYAEMLGSFRASTTTKLSSASAVAWVRQGEIIANQIPTKPYSASRLRQSIEPLRQLTSSTDPGAFVPQLSSIAASAGLTVVFLHTPKGCPAYGATKWLAPDKPMLLLSNRYKSHDTLWFTFFHEVCHILRHSKKTTVIEGSPSLDSGLEAEADSFAANVLIPPEYARRLGEIPRDHAGISSFAKEIGTAPGIVLGRMQKEGLVPWSRCSDLKVRYELEPAIAMR